MQGVLVALSTVRIHGCQEVDSVQLEMTSLTNTTVIARSRRSTASCLKHLCDNGQRLSNLQCSCAGATSVYMWHICLHVVTGARGAAVSLAKRGRNPRLRPV